MFDATCYLPADGPEGWGDEIPFNGEPAPDGGQLAEDGEVELTGF